jgi:hypothetical protein
MFFMVSIDFLLPFTRPSYLITALWSAVNQSVASVDKVIWAEFVGHLGDSRTDLEEFVPIKGGLIVLERIGEVELEAFEIGRYPVTNQWFARFVDAGGYENKSLWTPKGLLFLKSRQINGPRLVTDQRFNCPIRRWSRYCFLTAC